MKELTGNSLTLTTGRTGAKDLTISTGTYVLIIYVDENGNVNEQGTTATDVVIQGNTQPVTSDAVANAIQQVSVSYSTDEQPTGGTWINGKPIYRRVFTWNTKVSDATHFEIPYLDTMVKCSHIVRDNLNDNDAGAPWVKFSNRGLNTCYATMKWLNGSWNSTNGHWWIEYTKATD